MAKKVEAYIKLQVAAGQPTQVRPVGPALGQHGVNIMEFCKAFNAQTQSLEPGAPVPVVITVYNDRSFHLHHEDATCGVLAEESWQNQEWLWSSEH